MVEGHLDEAEGLVQEAFAISQRAHGDEEVQLNGLQAYQTQTYFLRMERDADSQISSTVGASWRSRSIYR